MNKTDLILAVIGYSENHTIIGRTLLQKMVYFVNELGKQEMDFYPHYYGPYSESVASATDSLVAVGLVEEQVETYQPFNFGETSEPRRFKYKLTKQGENALKNLEEKHRKDIDQIKGHIEKIKKLGMASDYRNLSIAAKIHHILRRQGKTMRCNEISDEARALGWALTPEDVQEVVDFLEKIGLAKRTQPAN